MGRVWKRLDRVFVNLPSGCSTFNLQTKVRLINDLPGVVLSAIATELVVG